MICANSSPTIRGNRILQGTGSEATFPIAIGGGSPVVEENTITGTVNLSMSGAPVIRNRVVIAVDPGAGGVGSVGAGGIFIYESMGFIEGNTFYAASGCDVAAIS